MPIPDLTDDGWLPPGEHPCSVEEICQRFASNPHDARCRVDIADALESYSSNTLVQTLADHILVDGSFVSGKAEPNDVDLLVGLERGFKTKLLSRGLNPAGAIRTLQAQRGTAPDITGKDLLDVHPFEVGSKGYTEFRQFFQTSDRTDEPDDKGILKVAL